MVLVPTINSPWSNILNELLATSVIAKVEGTNVRCLVLWLLNSICLCSVSRSSQRLRLWSCLNIQRVGSCRLVVSLLGISTLVIVSWLIIVRLVGRRRILGVDVSHGCLRCCLTVIVSVSDCSGGGQQ